MARTHRVKHTAHGAGDRVKQAAHGKAFPGVAGIGRSQRYCVSAFKRLTGVAVPPPVVNCLKSTHSAALF